jgi:hypothetical protein
MPGSTPGTDSSIANVKQVRFWIEEEANKRGTWMMAIIPLFLVGCLAIPFVYGVGPQFLYAGFALQAGLGWWPVSFAVYALLFGIVATALIAIDYRLRGQIVKVGLSDAGVWLSARRVSRFIAWGKFIPGGELLPSGRGYRLTASKPGSTWRVSVFVVGPRSGAAIIANPGYPQNH